MKTAALVLTGTLIGSGLSSVASSYVYIDGTKYLTDSYLKTALPAWIWYTPENKSHRWTVVAEAPAGGGEFIFECR